MNLPEGLKYSSHHKIPPSVSVHSMYNNEDNEKNALRLKKYFPKHYANLSLNVRSGPTITKIKRVKTIRSFNGFLKKKASQNLGLTLLKGQFKTLRKLPSLDVIAFWKKEKTFNVFSDALNKYLPYFTQIHQLKINFYAQVIADNGLTETDPIKVFHFISRIKTLRTFSVVVEGDLAPLKVLDAFFKKLQKFKATFERLEDFAVWVWNKGEKNHWDQVFPKYPFLMKYITQANIELFNHNFTSEGINLLIRNSPKLQTLTTLLKLENHEESLNFDQLTKLTNLNLTIDSDLVLFTKLFRLPPSIETLKLQFTNQKSIYQNDLLINSANQWENLDKLRTLEVKIIGDTNLLKTVEAAFSPIFEKTPHLFSLNIALEIDTTQSGRIEPDFETPLLGIPSLFTQKSVQNLGSTLKSLALSFGYNEALQDENMQILKQFENLSSFKLSIKNLEKSLATQILQHFLKKFKNKPQSSQEELLIHLENIQINSFEEFVVFIQNLKSLKMTEKLAGKFSLQVHVMLEEEDDYKECFEEICKFMSSNECSSWICFQFEFKNSSEQHAFTGMIKSYPKCKKFEIVLPRVSLNLTFQNGSQVGSRYLFPWVF